MSRPRGTQLLRELVDEEFVVLVGALAGSPRAQDRLYARSLLHRVYGTIMRRRATVRDAMRGALAVAVGTAQGRHAVPFGILAFAQLYTRCPPHPSSPPSPGFP